MSTRFIWEYITSPSYFSQTFPFVLFLSNTHTHTHTEKREITKRERNCRLAPLHRHHTLEEDLPHSKLRTFAKASGDQPNLEREKCCSISQVRSYFIIHRRLYTTAHPPPHCKVHAVGIGSNRFLCHFFFRFLIFFCSNCNFVVLIKLVLWEQDCVVFWLFISV